MGKLLCRKVYYLLVEVVGSTPNHARRHWGLKPPRDVEKTNILKVTTLLISQPPPSLYSVASCLSICFKLQDGQKSHMLHEI